MISRKTHKISSAASLPVRSCLCIGVNVSEFGGDLGQEANKKFILAAGEYLHQQPYGLINA